MNPFCETTICPVLLSSSCVFYMGDNLVCTGISTNETLELALSKINDTICSMSTPTLQQVTNAGALTTTGIAINRADEAPALNTNNTNGLAIYATSDNGVVARFILDTSGNTSNIAEFQKMGSNQAYVTHNGTIVGNKLLVNNTVDNLVDRLQVNGSLVATSIKKSGGLSTQYLMADGSTSTGTSGSTPDLQQVTTAGASSSNRITVNTTSSIGINTTGASIGLNAFGNSTGIVTSSEGTGIISSASNLGIKAEASTGTGIAGQFNVPVNSTANIAEFRKNNVNQAYITNNGIIVGNRLLVNTTNTSGTDSLKVEGSMFSKGIVSNIDVGSNFAITATSNLGRSISAQSFSSAETIYAYNSSNGLGINSVSLNGKSAIFETAEFNTNNIVEFKNDSVTQAYVKYDGGIVGNSIIKSGGTSDQILLADGTTSLLSLKQNSLGYTPFRFFTGAQSIGTNSVGETEMIRITIPANSFAANDRFKFRFAISKIGTANVSNIRVKLSTLPSMPSGVSNVIAILNPTNTTTYAPVERNMAIIGGNLKGLSFSSSSPNDSGTSTTASFQQVAFDVTQTQYLYVSINVNTTTDVSFLETAELTN